jgi:hypothetical protein
VETRSREGSPLISRHFKNDLQLIGGVLITNVSGWGGTWAVPG